MSETVVWEWNDAPSEGAELDGYWQIDLGFLDLTVVVEQDKESGTHYPLLTYSIGVDGATGASFLRVPAAEKIYYDEKEAKEACLLEARTLLKATLMLLGG